MKTIEEAAKEYSGRNEDKYSTFAHNYNKYDLESAFMKGVEFAQRWIPVEEERPPINEKVQVKILIAMQKEIEIDHDRLIYEDENLWLFDIEQQAGITVISWRKIKLL